MRYFVPPCGIEPQPSEPESEILSIKLRRQFHRIGTGCFFNNFTDRGTANIAIFSEYPEFFVFLSGYVSDMRNATAKYIIRPRSALQSLQSEN